jgi:hypothetical protein
MALGTIFRRSTYRSMRDLSPRPIPRAVINSG